jgi:RNA-binding protein YlmH
MGFFDRARWFLKQALKLTDKQKRGHLLICLTLIENRADTGDISAKNDYIKNIVTDYPISYIKKNLEKLKIMHDSPPVDVDMVKESILAYLESTSKIY